MDHNIAAWMIGGGPHVETERSWREREQLHALLDAQRSNERSRSLVTRIRLLVRPAAPAQPACCPA